MPQIQRFLARTGGLMALTCLVACTAGDPGNESEMPASGMVQCSSLAGQIVNDAVRISDADVLAATDRTPEFCKATAAFSESTLRFSAWLPTAGWNGKLAFIGGGGFDGKLMDEDFSLVFSPSVLADGYAVVATNGGYDAPASPDPMVYFQAEFAANEQQRADFMYRSEHRALPYADALVSRFYGEPPSHRYFEGCSMGGHDAMLLSQRYPDDFDGIVARAPAGNIMGLMLAFNRIGSFIRENDIVVDASQRQRLAGAVLQQCDALDGLADGIISRPADCSFDPGNLLCSGSSDAACLTSRDVALVNRVTSPMRAAEVSISHPGYFFGGEDQEKGWGEYVWPKMAGYSVGMLFSQGFIRAFVTGDDSFDTWNWKPSEWQAKLAQLNEDFNAFDPDIGAFRDSGGKLILWNGTVDTSVSAKDTIRYYENVVSELGTQSAANTIELFLAPGVAHCSGGAGPDQVDLMQALASWVEQGKPPSTQQLVHRKVNDSGATVMTRPVCAYPAYPHYDGEGDPVEAASFNCRNP